MRGRMQCIFQASEIQPVHPFSGGRKWTTMSTQVTTTPQNPKKRQMSEMTTKPNGRDESIPCDDAEWSSTDLTLLNGCINNARYIAQHSIQLTVEFVLKLIERPLHYWKNGDHHPLLLCTCPNPVSLRCKYFGTDKKQMFGCASWSPAASSGHEAAMQKWIKAKSPTHQMPVSPFCDKRLYERDAKAILEKIAATLGRSSLVHSFFSPLGVRLAEHVGFSLVNHIPPLCSDTKWRMYDTSFSLKEQSAFVTHDNLLEWREMRPNSVNPSLFEGFIPSVTEQLAVRSLVQKFIDKGFTLSADKVQSHCNAMSEPEEVKDLAQHMNDSLNQGIMVQRIPHITKMLHHVNYVLRVGVAKFQIFLLPTLLDGTIVALQLHGMGNNDLGPLYGHSTHMLFYDGATDADQEKALFISSGKIFRAALMLEYQCLDMSLGKEAHQGTSSTRPGIVLASLIADANAEEEFTSDVHNHDEKEHAIRCGPACVGSERAYLMQNRMEQPPSNAMPSIKNLVQEHGIVKCSLSGHAAHDLYLLFTIAAFREWVAKNDLEESIPSAC